jgi:hypothetical protein
MGRLNEAPVWNRFLFTATMALAMLALAPSSSTPRTEDAEASINGVITGCWEGHRITVANVRVYVLGEDESSQIRDDLQKLENPPRNGDTVDIHVYSRLYDQLVEDLKPVRDAQGLVRADKQGHFSAKPLKIKHKYLVLAIDWDKGDTDEMAYYRYKFVDIVEPGPQKVQIYVGPGEGADCKWK